MRILEVSRYKDNFADNQLPFVTEQGEALRAAGCEVDYFLVRGNYLRAVKALKAKIREYKPDIVHAHFGLSAITAELQSLVPVVTTFHNGETLKWYINLVTSLMSLRAKHVIYVAQHIYDLCYFKAKRYSIIPCGVPMEQMVITPKEEARKQLGWDANKKYILFGGAFSNERKNYALLRDAVNRLNELRVESRKSKVESDAQSAVYGVQCTVCMNELTNEGVRELIVESRKSKVESNPSTLHTPQSTERSVPQLGAIVCIEMNGLSRAECVLRMCAADLFALPSHSEGSPQALKEAMAVNCPCLATDIADVRELFGDAPGHFILRNPRKTHERWDADERSLDEMTDLLRTALAFEGRTNGRERIIETQLTNEQIAQRLIEIYKEIDLF